MNRIYQGKVTADPSGIGYGSSVIDYWPQAQQHHELLQAAGN